MKTKALFLSLLFLAASSSQSYAQKPQIRLDFLQPEAIAVQHSVPCPLKKGSKPLAFTITNPKDIAEIMSAFFYEDPDNTARRCGCLASNFVYLKYPNKIVKITVIAHFLDYNNREYELTEKGYETLKKHAITCP